MKAKERERRREYQYVLEKDTHRHTRRDGESPSPGVPTLDKVATGFGLGSPNFPRPETSQIGEVCLLRAEGIYKILDPKQFLTVQGSHHTEKIIKTSSNSGAFVRMPRQIRSQSPLSLTEASHLPQPGHDPSTGARSCPSRTRRSLGAPPPPPQPDRRRDAESGPGRLEGGRGGGGWGQVKRLG